MSAMARSFSDAAASRGELVSGIVRGALRVSNTYGISAACVAFRFARTRLDRRLVREEVPIGMFPDRGLALGEQPHGPHQRVAERNVPAHRQMLVLVGADDHIHRILLALSEGDGQIFGDDPAVDDHA